MGFGLFEEVLHVSAGGVEGDVEIPGRFLDALSLHQFDGDAGLGGRESVEVLQDASVGFVSPVGIDQEDRDRGMIPAGASSAR